MRGRETDMTEALFAGHMNPEALAKSLCHSKESGACLKKAPPLPAGRPHGRDVQVDPLRVRYQNSSRKRAWFQRLKRKCDEPLSNVAFNFNLRRYSPAPSSTRRTSR